MLFDPMTGRAAAYNGTHRWITGDASKKLVQYALDHAVQTLDFDPAQYDPASHIRTPLPEWATPEVQTRMKLIWIDRGGLTDDEWMQIPKK